LEILNREIQDAPNYARAWSNRAAIYFVSGQRDAARRDAETALRLDPGNPQARNVLKLLNQ
jgi:Flp pilus assembly protein TadD